ncbi:MULTISPECIES: FadR/GntR family transcriptional regulator [Paraburkholderia]|jgi:DNA-binding FadR family transcriptional regulator|uniref:Transcriptional regulator, GntR family n=1 Tax=Paraburkholderia phenazinium TaxID=60549 RepID=A0A1N6JDM3_9BURK|nr:FCD domain-containing protein [Paraburkholderia phenazinium]SIO42380.1 transcriptional regulator, GntR family [Paraburkholderia phenazinium]SIO49903.1 transcriptional regulator, GntR family [Paraburkholderia phenazinium]
MEDFEAVAAALSQRIADGAFLPEGRLPTERELAVEYRIPRSGVRKALANIEREGMIVRSVGRGTFVAGSLPPSFEQEDLADISPADLNLARLLLEPGVAEHAALHATAADLASIEKCMLECENAKDVKSVDFWDANLHMAIAKATHNSFIAFTFKALHQVRQSPSWSQVKYFAVTPERFEVTVAAHRAIVSSILRRDAAAARRAMETHIEQIGKYIANRD